MRKLISAVATLAAAAAVAACHRDREAMDAGPQTTRDYQVGDFSGIEVAGPYDVRVKTGGKPGVRVTGPANVLERLVVEVDDGKLEIHTRSKHGFGSISWSSHKPVIVEVSASALTNATIAGSGDISVDKVTGDKFEGAIAGSGSLRLASVDVGELNMDVGGSGSATGSGKAGKGDYNIAGSGDIDLGGVALQDVDVAIAGSGNVSANASGNAKVSIMGSGDVTVTGGAKCDVSKMGSGDVHCS